MKEHALYFIMLFTFVIFMYASVIQGTAYGKEKKLDYSTEHVREIWQACSFNFQAQFPQIPQAIRWPLCDCYVDHLRKNLTSLQVKTLSPIEAKTLGLQVAVVCPIPKEFHIQPETLFKDPPIIPNPSLEYNT